MKWSFKIGRILGIDVYIHVTFLLLLAFVGVANYMTDRSAGAAISGALFFLSIFLCVLLHEYGHALAARQYGIKTHDITLLPIGGLARLERMPDRPGQELWVALAGPAVNVVIAVGLALGLWVTNQWQPLNSLSTTEGNLAERLLAVNVLLVVFNLLPAFPMDGGRVLRSLLAMRMEYARATSIAATIGQGMALVFGFIGLFTNPMLLFIALFVWMGASQESAATQMRSSLSGARVRDAMLTEFHSLESRETLGNVSRLLLAGSQQDFPVVEQGVVQGVVLRADLFQALGRSGVETQVGSIMRRDFVTVDANEPLENALAQAQAEKGLVMPVLNQGRLIGLLTAENVGEFYMIRSAIRRNPPAPPPRLTAVPPPLPVSAAPVSR